MKLSIEPFTVNTGFVFDTGVSFETDCEFSDFISGNTLTRSLIFKWAKGSSGKSLTKVFSPVIDVTGFKEIVFSVFSRNFKNKGVSFNKASDFQYKIDFASAGDEFLIPLGTSMHDVTMALGSITSVDRIKITALHDIEDFLFLSNMISVKDEIPVDIFESIVERLDFDFVNKFGDGIKVGTVSSASAGDNHIVINGDRFFVDKYAVLKIKDGSNEEIIQLFNNNENRYELSKVFNNGILANSYTSADLFLQFPVNFGMNEDEIILPGITIWGFTPEHILRGAKLEAVLDSYKVDNTVTERRDFQIQKYEIAIDVMARDDELMAEITAMAREFINRELLFINGRRYEIFEVGVPTEVEPVEPVNKIAKIQYRMSIEIKEELDTRKTLVNTDTINTTVSIT